MKALRKLVLFAILVVSIVSALVLGNRTRHGLSGKAVAQGSIGGLQCGQWAAYRVCELMGIPVSPKMLLDRMPPNPSGHSLKDIAEFLGHGGLETRGRKETLETFLKEEGVRVVHLKSPEHFVVVTRVGSDRIYFLDHGGRRQVTFQSNFRRHWTGNVLHVERPTRGHMLGFHGEDLPVAAPRVQFETLFIDKGDLLTTSQTESVTFEFSFQNLGDRELLFQKVHTNCACLLVKKPETAVAPGKTGVVTLEYRLDKTRQAFQHEAVVETNDPANPVIVLRAAGNTNVLVTVSPPVLNFGTVPVEVEQRALLFVRYNGEEEFFVKSAKSELSGLSFRIHEDTPSELKKRLWPGSSAGTELGKNTRVVEVVLAETRPGDLKQDIVLETNIGRFETVRVPVSARIVPPVSFWPSVLAFGETTSGENVERKMTLRSTTSQPLRVVGISPQPTGLEWSVLPQQGNSPEINLRIAATGSVAQKLAGLTLTVKVESAGVPYDLSLPVYAAKRIVSDKNQK